MPEARRTRLVRMLVALYPRAWRARYGEEFAALLADSRLSLRRLLDVVAAAGRERARAATGAGVYESPWPRVYRANGRIITTALLCGAVSTAAGQIAGAQLLRHGWTIDDVPDWFWALMLLPLLRAFLARWRFRRKDRAWAVGKVELIIWLATIATTTAALRLDERCFGKLPCGLQDTIHWTYTSCLSAFFVVGSTLLSLRIRALRFKLMRRRLPRPAPPPPPLSLY